MKRKPANLAGVLDGMLADCQSLLAAARRPTRRRPKPAAPAVEGPAPEPEPAVAGRVPPAAGAVTRARDDAATPDDRQQLRPTFARSAAAVQARYERSAAKAARDRHDARVEADRAAEAAAAATAGPTAAPQETRPRFGYRPYYEAEPFADRRVQASDEPNEAALRLDALPLPRERRRGEDEGAEDE